MHVFIVKISKDKPFWSVCLWGQNQNPHRHNMVGSKQYFFLTDTEKTIDRFKYIQSRFLLTKTLSLDDEMHENIERFY
jgi:hypothetical protein